MKVLSIEQMTKLKDLGVDVSPKEDCLMYSAVGGDSKLMYGQSVCEDDIKAFDFQDIFCLLPTCIEVNDCIYFISVGKAGITYMAGFYAPIIIIREELIDAAYDMLIWLIENKYL